MTNEPIPGRAPDDSVLLAQRVAPLFEKHVRGVLPQAKTVVGEGNSQDECTIETTAGGATLKTTLHATIDDITLVTGGRREVMPHEEWRVDHPKMILHARSIKGMFDLRDFLADRGADYGWESPEEYLDRHAYLFEEYCEEVRSLLAGLASGYLNALTDMDEPLAGLREQVEEVAEEIKALADQTCGMCGVFGDGDPCAACEPNQTRRQGHSTTVT